MAVFIFKNFLTSFLITFLYSEFAVSVDRHCFSIVTDYYVQFIVREGSVNFYLLINIFTTTTTTTTNNNNNNNSNNNVI